MSSRPPGRPPTNRPCVARQLKLDPDAAERLEAHSVQTGQPQWQIVSRLVLRHLPADEEETS